MLQATAMQSKSSLGRGKGFAPQSRLAEVLLKVACPHATFNNGWEPPKAPCQHGEHPQVRPLSGRAICPRRPKPPAAVGKPRYQSLA